MCGGGIEREKKTYVPIKKKRFTKYSLAVSVFVRKFMLSII